MRPPPSPHWSSLYPSLDLSDGLSDNSLSSPLYTGGPGLLMELNRANSMPPTAWSSHSPHPTSSYSHNASRSNQAIADASHESLMEHRNLAYIRIYEENRSIRGLVNRILEALPRLNQVENPSKTPLQSSGPSSGRRQSLPAAVQTGDKPLPGPDVLNDGSAIFKFGATSELQLGVAYWNIPLDRDFYGKVKFWKLGDYTTDTKAAAWNELNGETQKAAHQPYLFLQNPDGSFISSAESRGLNHAICSVFRDIAVDPRYPIANTSGEIPMAHMQYMYSVIYPSWPITRYCVGHWKLNLVITKIYSSWKSGYDTSGKKKRSMSSTAPNANVEPQTKRKKHETSSTSSSMIPPSHYNADTSSAPEPISRPIATPVGETQSTGQAGTSDQNVPTPSADPSQTNPRKETGATRGSPAPREEASGNGISASDTSPSGSEADKQAGLPHTETEGVQKSTDTPQASSKSSQPSASAPVGSVQQALLNMIEGSANPPAPVRHSSTPPPDSLNNPLPLSTISPAPLPSKPKTRGARQKKGETASDKDGAIFKPTKHNTPMMICGRDYMRDHPEAVGKITKGEWKKIWDPISRNADAMKALEQRAIEYKEAKKK
ncbi:hypothetical protein NLI96_g10485 [Meripilus lineatus]|uniref:Uncharacterized protein n=1 Tax=Meripilus lineatus TaxID=2056292 RepID=A0AAD5YE64_9APHY|nr:hypothetical protein NLI96_g10485 [Physisporinus lineatus]